VTESPHNKKIPSSKFYAGFSNPNRDTIFKLEIINRPEYWKKQFRKLVLKRTDNNR
jgi:chromosome partitioning protein